MPTILSWKGPCSNINLEVSRNLVGAPSLIVGGGEYKHRQYFWQANSLSTPTFHYTPNHLRQQERSETIVAPKKRGEYP